MSIPDWWEALVLALAAWRIFQLVAFDSVLDQPRRYITRLGKEWEKEGDALPKEYREKWALFINCPYCLGAWLSLGVYCLWLWLPTAALVLGTLSVLNAGVIALNRLIGSE